VFLCVSVLGKMSLCQLVSSRIKSRWWPSDVLVSRHVGHAHEQERLTFELWPRHKERTGARALESVEAVARRCVAGAIKPTCIHCVKLPSSVSNKSQDTGVCDRGV
jgi:hypothetical protein